MIVKLKMFTTGKILVEISVLELETSNVGKIFGKNLGISKIWVYNETCFFYIKAVIVMFLGFTNTKISK